MSEPGVRQGHVFISYSRADSAVAERVVSAFHKAGVSFAIDRMLLEAGDSLTGKLGEALDGAIAVVALISKNSIKSAWVLRELATVQGRGIRVVPVKCDDEPWPGQMSLLLGDALYVDGRDVLEATGRLPKLFMHAPTAAAPDLGSYFALSNRPRTPYARVLAASLESALDESSFGRVLLVVPTDQQINLAGKVTTAVLETLSISAADLAPSTTRITPRQVAPLTVKAYKDVEVHLVASTVFSGDGQLRAVEQWRAAEAVLEAAQQRSCALALVPPMGTGVYGWPAKAAVRHWLFGAMRWAASAPVTEEAVWPIICQPGAGAQAALRGYLSTLDSAHLRRLQGGYVRFIVERSGERHRTEYVPHSSCLGPTVVSAFPSLRDRRDLVVAPGFAIRERHPSHSPYQLDEALKNTVFADGDTLDVIDRPR